ncbi:MAG TPA: 3-isopropylmalate dehydratase small subunit [bacterium]|nr:3-isopropylmalate dehydratase small subunit [bacterium]HOL67366.1 3-isopropylmalate dehydratase small subunit [bacterium]
MVLKGQAHKFGDDINTDYIISGKYKFKTLDMKELASHLMEDLDPQFSQKVRPGDILVAGKNFGCGSSREQAPLVIKSAGIPLVIARSFARIFFRNALNVGLFLLEADTESISGGDLLEVNLTTGIIRNLSRGSQTSAQPLPEFLVEIAREGGVVAYLRKYGQFKI